MSSTTGVKFAPVESEVWIDGPPEKVFAYFTDPEKLRSWLGEARTLDPQPGGAFNLVVSEGYTAIGEYLEVHPFERLVLSWGWEERSEVPPGSTRVEITLTPERSGTRVHLSHTGLPSKEEQQKHAKGWGNCLGSLVQVFTWAGNAA